jgi:hypothetical protein
VALSDDDLRILIGEGRDGPTAIVVVRNVSHSAIDAMSVALGRHVAVQRGVKHCASDQRCNVLREGLLVA